MPDLDKSGHNLVIGVFSGLALISSKEICVDTKKRTSLVKVLMRAKENPDQCVSSRIKEP